MLCTNDWEELYPDCILLSQATEISDHCPLVLGLMEGILGKRRFHFESFWTKPLVFHETVENSWKEPIGGSCPIERVSLKLKRLTRALQSWSQRQVGHIKTEHALAREILHRLEIAQDQRQLTREENWLRGELKKHCLVLASRDRTIVLFSHLRIGLFHRTAGYRKRKNFIPKLLKEDQVVTGQEEKQDVMFDYFDGLLGTALPRTLTLDLPFFHRSGIDLSVLSINHRR